MPRGLDPAERLSTAIPSTVQYCRCAWCQSYKAPQAGLSSYGLGVQLASVVASFAEKVAEPPKSQRLRGCLLSRLDVTGLSEPSDSRFFKGAASHL